MPITYRRFDGCRVSRPWFRLLRDLRANGTPFHLNSGHRTMAEQAELVRQKGVWSPSNRTGAARPTPTAPHIRLGLFNHACDFNNAAAVETAAARRAVILRANVPGEPWHLDPDRATLLAYYRRRNKQIAAGKRQRLRARAEAALKRALARLRRRRTSKAGIRMIREFEGCRLKPYNDPDQPPNATIGVGHKIHDGPVTRADRNKYVGFTTVAAEKLLAADLKPFEKAVRKSPMPLTQAQFDALVSATMNLGAGVLGPGHSLGDALRTGDKRKVAAALLLYTHAGGRVLPGLVRRRKIESQAFLK